MTYTDIFQAFHGFNFKATANLNFLFNLSLCVRNNPPLGNVVSIWQTSAGTSTIGNANVISEQPDEHICFWLSTQVNSIKDYGNYTLTLASSTGALSKSFTFEVEQTLSPTSPTDFTVTHCGSHTANFTWRSGLSGKALTKMQYIHILYREWHSFDLNRATVPKLNNATAFSLIITNCSENEASAAQLGGLVSGIRYVFAIYARNANGLESKPSEAAACTTENISPERDTGECNCVNS